MNRFLFQVNAVWKILSIWILFQFCIQSCSGQTSLDSLSNDDYKGYSNGLDVHFGNSQLYYGGEIGIGVRCRKLLVDVNYSLYSFPFNLTLSSDRHFVISGAYLVGKKIKKRNFLCALTYMHFWNVDPNSKLLGSEYGINNNLIYPSIGYYNQKIGKSIFGFSARFGLVPLFLHEYNTYKFNGVMPLIQIDLRMRLYNQLK